MFKFKKDSSKESLNFVLSNFSAAKSPPTSVDLCNMGLHLDVLTSKGPPASWKLWTRLFILGLCVLSSRSLLFKEYWPSFFCAILMVWSLYYAKDTLRDQKLIPEIKLLIWGSLGLGLTYSLITQNTEIDFLTVTTLLCTCLFAISSAVSIELAAFDIHKMYELLQPISTSAQAQVLKRINELPANSATKIYANDVVSQDRLFVNGDVLAIFGQY